MYFLRCLSLLVFVALSVVGVSSVSHAQNFKNKPPVTVKGFTHRYQPATQMHSNTCRVKTCEPGAYVSYIVYKSGRNFSFGSFRKNQNRVASILRKRAKPGVKITVEAPQKKTVKHLTIYSSYRKIKSPDGSSIYTYSQAIFGRKHSFSVISTADSKQQAYQNGAQFAAGLIVLDGR